MNTSERVKEIMTIERLKEEMLAEGKSWGNYTPTWEEALEGREDTAEPYINATDKVLQATAPVGRALGAVTSAPLTAYLNTPPGMLASSIIGNIYGHLADTDTAKEAIGTAAGWAEDNPRAARMAGNAADSLEILPWTKGIKTLSRAGMGNVKTKLEGFYNGRQFGSFFDAIKEGGESTWNSLFNTQDIADLRVKGPAAGKQRAVELRDSKLDNDKQGNKHATALMNSQMKGEWDNSSLANQLPSVQGGYLDQTHATNRPRVLEGLQADGAPPEIAEQLYDSAMKAHSRGSRGEKIVEGVANVGSYFTNRLDNALVGIRNIRGGHTGLGHEALGHRGRGSKSMTMLRGNNLDTFAKNRGKTADDLTGPDMVEFLEGTSQFERGGWFPLRKALGLDANASPTATHQKYLRAKNKPLATRTPDEARLVGIVDERIAGKAGGELTKAEKARALYISNKKPPNHTKAQKAEMKAQLDALDAKYADRDGPLSAAEQGEYNKILNKQTGLTPDQREFMEYVEASQGTGKGNILYTPDPEAPDDPSRGTVRYRTSFTSGDTDLGGVSFGGVVDLNNKQLYGLVSDQHDMMGVDPIGGRSLMNFSPVQSSGYGTRRETADQVKERLAPTQAIRDTEERAAQSLEAKTGMSRYKKETAAEYKQRVGAGEGESVKAAQERTGTKQRTTDESIGMLENRVMNDYRAPKQYDDYLTSLQNKGMFGMASAPAAGEVAESIETAGGLPAELLNSGAKERLMEMLKHVGEVSSANSKPFTSREEQQ